LTRRAADLAMPFEERLLPNSSVFKVRREESTTYG